MKGPMSYGDALHRASDICNWVGAAILSVMLGGAYTIAGLDAAILVVVVFLVSFINGYIVGAFRTDAKRELRRERS